MNPLPAEDFTPYSDKDLQDLMRITQQTLDHYSRMLHSTTVNPGYKHSIRFCYTQTEKDLEDIKREVERRRRPVLMAAEAQAADVKIELQESPLTQSPKESLNVKSDSETPVNTGQMAEEGNSNNSGSSGGPNGN
jgi:hypothetical protein